MLEAARKLAFTTAVVVGVGVDRQTLEAPTYFYDPDVIFRG
jgi:hypothetical protein